MRILILTGKFGMGHWSASQSLRQQLLSAFPDAEIAVEDLVAYAMPNLSDSMYKGFNLLVTKGSGILNTIYKITENGPTDSRTILEPILVEKVEELLAQRQPDVVIATHPFCAQAISRYKSESGDDLPLITCITDLSAHSEWINSGTDCYLVGSPDLRRALVRKGVDKDIIYASGIPVKEEFKHLTARREDGKRHLLIMGGGLGLMPKKDEFYEALNAMADVETVLITGGNQKLYDKLAGKYPHIEVVGYTDRVYDYMAWADLMLSKPGGITLFETIFSELPILVWEPFLQQEINNARFLIRAGIGRIAHKEWDECLAAVDSLINDPAALTAMRENMRALKDQLEDESVSGIVNALAHRKGVCA